MDFVRFNLSLAGFKRGQVIPYHELTPGQQFWVDNEDILGSERIAHFCDKEGKIIEPGDELEESIDLADEVAPDETPPEEKKLDFDFDESKKTDEEPDQTEQTETEPEAAESRTCRGTKSDGSRCNNKAGPSGYCHILSHLNQA